MKWKKLTRESVNDASEKLNGLEYPVKIIKVFDVLPIQYSINGMNEDAYYLIEEYIGDIATKYYTNGEIPEDEEGELRESLVAVGVEFEYRDSYSDDRYVMDDILFIIDRNDMSIVEQSRYDYPEDVEGKVMEAATEFVQKNY